MNHKIVCRSLRLLAACLLVDAAGAQQPGAPRFEDHIAPLFKKYCVGCHNEEEADGELVLESYRAALEGGESGPVIVPGQSGRSRIVLLLEGKAKPKMPPGKRPAPSPQEVALLKAWIDAGARGPGAAAARSPLLDVPRIDPVVPPRRAIHALACARRGERVAVARHGGVEILSVASREPLGAPLEFPGTVNALAFSGDGSLLLAAGGVAGVRGEARLWNVAGGSEIAIFGGHRDALHAAALSPDGRLLVTGGYDRTIKLWDARAGREIRTLAAHNDAVFDLAFRADGKVFASASGDRTVKLWSAETGDRLETFSQSLKAVHAVAFSPDGRQLVAGGVDNRIRLWRISAAAAEGTNPLVYSRFAHEGAILDLVYSVDGRRILSAADDRTVKIWNAASLEEEHLLERQPDWPVALQFSADGGTALVACLDGSLRFYHTRTGRSLRLARAAGRPSRWLAASGVLPLFLGALFAGEDPEKSGAPPKPSIERPVPRGVERGVASRILLEGKNLAGVTALEFQDARIAGKILPRAEGDNADALQVEITTAGDLPPGDYEFSLVSPAGKSGKARIHVDDLRQVAEVEPNDTPSAATVSDLPVSFWGALESRGDVDLFGVDAAAGETLVVDLAASRLGSKLDGVLSLLGPDGDLLATRNDFDGDADPLLVHEVRAGGRHTIRVGDLALGASANHFYRLSVGSFAYVTGCHPLSVPPNSESDVALAGFNLPREVRVRVRAGDAGEVALPLDHGRFRSRRGFKVLVERRTQVREVEPNGAPDRATPIDVPVVALGRIWAAEAGSAGDGPDVDLFRLEANAGETWIIEVDAARLGSPLDSVVEVLHGDGRPVKRLLFESVRDTYINFRSIDANSAGMRLANWEEMHLNQYLYLEGEVCRLFRMPQGPDSDMLVYTSNGKRRGYFDTTPSSHANGVDGYIVEPHPPGTELVPNGLPVFTLYYANDDDGERRLDRDSRLTFTAPATGVYLIRVRDVNGFGGGRYGYRLIVRRPEPDFKVTLHGADPTVPRASGKEFHVTVERLDGFDGDVAVEIDGVPDGFTVSTPLVIEAGHREAKGTIFARADATSPSAEELARINVRATATIAGERWSRVVNSLGKIRLAETPKLMVRLEPIEGASGDAALAALKIEPGASARAMLRVERNGYDGLVTFAVDNLPHGVIVDNIGLNGVLIPAGEIEREIFLSAENWVGETSRLCHAVANQEGRPTSLPVWLHVRKR